MFLKKCCSKQEAFQIYDLDGDGLISAKDLKDLFKTLDEKISVEEVEDMFNNITDKTINFDEFKLSYQSFRKIKENLSKKLGPEKLSSVSA